MRIKDLRIASNIQQKQLAEKLGVLQSTISNWETGVALPSSSKLPALASALGCTIDDLFEAPAEQEEDRNE